MKRLGILVLIVFCMSLSPKGFAQSQFSATLTRMEKSLFGMDYNSQTDDARLKRLEDSVYGSPSSGSAQVRVNKLSKDLSADLIGQEIKPKSDTFADADDAESREPTPKADSNINYPSVNSLEKTVFNKEFKTMDIDKRLANLEQNVFKKTYGDDLNSRVDRLQHAIKPERVAQSDGDGDDSSSQPKDTDSFDDGGSLMDQTSQFQDNGYRARSAQLPTGFGANVPSYNENNSVLDEYPDNSDITVPLGVLEKKVMKRTYPNDTVSNRLLRMELKVFNSSFTDDDTQTRFERIASAYQAKKSSSRYDNNKFSQHAATAMQIGAILLMILAAIL